MARGGEEDASNYEMMASRRATPNSGGHSLEQGGSRCRPGEIEMVEIPFEQYADTIQYGPDTTSTIQIVLYVLYNEIFL